MSVSQKKLSSVLAKNDTNSYRAMQILINKEPKSKTGISSITSTKTFKFSMNPIGQSQVRFKWQTDKSEEASKGITGTMKNYKSLTNKSLGWDGLKFVNKEKNKDKDCMPIESLRKKMSYRLLIEKNTSRTVQHSNSCCNLNSSIKDNPIDEFRPTKKMDCEFSHKLKPSSSMTDLINKTPLYQPKSSVGTYHARALHGSGIFSPDDRPFVMARKTVELSKFKQDSGYAGYKVRKNEDEVRYFNKTNKIKRDQISTFDNAINKKSIVAPLDLNSITGIGNKNFSRNDSLSLGKLSTTYRDSINSERVLKADKEWASNLRGTQSSAKKSSSSLLRSSSIKENKSSKILDFENFKNKNNLVY